MNARTTRTLAAALSLTAALAISGCSSDSDTKADGAKSDDAKPTMTVSGAYMPEPVNDKMAGAFMVIKNDSKTADKLTGVTSPSRTISRSTRPRTRRCGRSRPWTCPRTAN